MQSSKLVVGSISCAELGTAQPQLVLFLLSLFFISVIHLKFFSVDHVLSSPKPDSIALAGA